MKKILKYSVRKNSKGLMGSRTQVHRDKRREEIKKRHKREIEE